MTDAMRELAARANLNTVSRIRAGARHSTT